MVTAVGRWALACALAMLLLAWPVAARALTWTEATVSPQRVNANADALYAACGSPDAGLARVATELVRLRVAGESPPDERALKRMVRAQGVPQLFPRAWSVVAVPEDELAPRMRSWVASSFVARRAPIRCGIARGGDAEGNEVIAAVAVEAHADLHRLERMVPARRWLSLDADLHWPDAEAAKVVLLGPRGRPRRVLASLSEGRVRSRFTLDMEGRWLVQVVAISPAGPRPVLEAEIFAGVDPPAELADEELEPAPSQDAAGMLALLQASRKAEGMTALRHDRRLDVLARAHAEAMVRSGRVAHDVGDGDPATRAAGLGVSHVGENIARAPSVERLHAVLWDSPSHRENMLDGSFTLVGIAVVADTRGRMWAVQLLAQ